uniref:AAA domain-containing protein n=1 Tax=Angiostrongylus cantonensis TaxID=6313 RepID=A0A0K0DQ91_ANGCA
VVLRGCSDLRAAKPNADETETVVQLSHWVKKWYPQNVDAPTVNRLCGSGFQTVISAAHLIKLGESKLVVAGGSENIAQVPFAVRNVRFGTALGAKYEFEDMLWESLSDPYAKLSMGQTAEKLRAQYKVSCTDADEFALRSQQLWEKAQSAGFFKAEIAPITVKGKKGEETFEVDEHPRPLTTLDSLVELKPVFQKDGLVNAGNASCICDGATAMVVAGDEAVEEYDLKPLIGVVSYATVGCVPTIMGIGPAPVIRQVLVQTGLKFSDIDIFEVNEAFVPQTLAVQRELGIPMEKLNLNGGAIALGHPLGASGARIRVRLVHELRRRNTKNIIYLALKALFLPGLQALLLNTLSKLTFSDSKRFNVLINDVFSSVNKEMATFGDLIEPLKSASNEMNIELTDKQLQKVFQLYEQLRQRIGVVVVGPTGSGKSTIWRVLKKAQLAAGVALRTVSFNPKAMNRMRLLGHMDIDTREWSDGILTMAARELTMPSGERIQFDNNVNFLFETDSLQFASPATVSRMGMIFVSEEDISVKEVVAQWVKSLVDEHPDLPDWIDEHFYRCYEWCVLAGLVNGIGRVAAAHNGLSHLR